MPNLGILAYGSLIEDPGDELKPLIVNYVTDVKTPFNIEFARSSSGRDGAPTVIPVEGFGSQVKAQILELSDNISQHEAETFLWRRETGRVGKKLEYKRPDAIGRNTMVVEYISNFYDFDTVLYTKLVSNIDEISSSKLADLAIASANGEAGRNGKDGISYLMSVMRQGIITNLSSEYEKEILHKTGTASLEEALAGILKSYN